MAFQFDQREPVPNAVRRLLTEQLDLAMGRLSSAPDGGPPEEKAIHDARKALKRSRAVIRLVRPALGRKRSRAANATYREAGMALSATRDADVLIATWDAVAPRVEGVDQDVLDAARRDFEAHRDRVRTEQPADVAAVVATLAEARRQVAEWPGLDDGWGTIEPGLRGIYEQGRDAMAAAVGGTDDEAWHEWRKRVKDTWYHLTLLVPAWERPLAAEEEEAHELSETLGLDHDLAVLRAEVDRRTEPWSPHEAAAVVAAIEGRQADLRAAAVVGGRRMYAESPKAFAARLAAYWDAWRDAEPAAAHLVLVR